MGALKMQVHIHVEGGGKCRISKMTDLSGLKSDGLENAGLGTDRPSEHISQDIC